METQKTPGGAKSGFSVRRWDAILGILATIMGLGFTIYNQFYQPEVSLVNDDTEKVDTIPFENEVEGTQEKVLEAETSQPVLKNKIPEKKKLVMFNSAEFMDREEDVALFITNDSELAHDFQQELSDQLNIQNVLASTSFFSAVSMPYYNRFYSANEGWLKEAGVFDHYSNYLIGKIIIENRSSSETSKITIVSVIFKGKFVSEGQVGGRPISLAVTKSSFVASAALSDAYKEVIDQLASNVKLRLAESA